MVVLDFPTDDFLGMTADFLGGEGGFLVEEEVGGCLEDVTGEDVEVGKVEAEGTLSGETHAGNEAKT